MISVCGQCWEFGGFGQCAGPLASIRPVCGSFPAAWPRPIRPCCGWAQAAMATAGRTGLSRPAPSPTQHIVGESSSRDAGRAGPPVPTSGDEHGRQCQARGMGAVRTPPQTPSSPRGCDQEEGLPAPPLPPAQRLLCTYCVQEAFSPCTIFTQVFLGRADLQIWREV